MTQGTLDWSQYKNFSKKEFDCKHTALNRMRPEFMERLQQIRTTYGKPLIITSGYRDMTHPVEAAKQNPGEHYYGCAADIAISGTDALDLMMTAYSYGIRRMGLKQTGSRRFLHIGMGDALKLNFPSTIWTY